MPTSPAGEVVDAEELRPIPRWFRWLRRPAVIGGVLLLIGIGVRVWWGHVAESRFQAAIAKYRAAGQPVLIEDFATEPVPDDENAALWFQRAAAAVVETKGPVELRDWPTIRQLARNHPQELQDLLAANEVVLADFRDGCARPRADWGVVLKSPLIDVLLPSLSGQRQLGRLASLAAAERHLAGDDAAAVALVRDKVAHARHVADHSPGLIAHLVRIALEGSAVRTIEWITPELRVGGDGAEERAGVAPAAREDVEALAATLLDEEPMRASWRRAIYGERLMQVDTAQCLINGNIPRLAGDAAPSPPTGRWSRIPAVLIGPAWKLDAVEAMANCTATAEAGSAPNWPAGRALLPPPPNATSGWTVFLSLITQVLAPSMEDATELQFSILAKRRMAATALALRLYELDHGHRPASLDELVPDYLPAVPRDPFAADNRPLSYLPDATSPVLYSVSLNGEDDEGRVALRPDGEIDWHELDIPFFLNGDRPLPRPRSMSASGATQPTSTQAVPDDEAVGEPDAEADETDEAQPEP
ncbi:MAG: hypothetical protein PVJ57_11765 [Phycisphaerae bacterium]|jgi:hypothetical protein